MAEMEVKDAMAKTPASLKPHITHQGYWSGTHRTSLLIVVM